MKAKRTTLLLDVGRFFIGQRVELSDAGREHFLSRGRMHLGTVIGQSSDKRFLRVRRDGQRTTYTWHPDYWKPSTSETK